MAFLEGMDAALSSGGGTVRRAPLEIDFVIQTCLISIYSENLFAESLFLKGGQAMRFKEKIRNRFSADTDFSTPTRIENSEAYFELLRESLAKSFHRTGVYLFDFEFCRKPKIRKTGVPDFWAGWSVEFKLIESEKRNLPAERLSREALVPQGAVSPVIRFDISEYEYCGAIERLKLESAEVQVYSRPLLVVEKLRAICQQHPDYPYKDGGRRARDFYDIERLWGQVLLERSHEVFLAECAVHLPLVFAQKEVPLVILERIFDESFLQEQERDWSEVMTTVEGKLQPFSYYVETLRGLVVELRRGKSE